MFTSPLPDANWRVTLSDHARRYHVKRFAKDYPGKQWAITWESITDSLRRIHTIALTQQVDELKRCDSGILFKYDFAVAKTKVSAKASGNRCVVYLDLAKSVHIILMVYGKTDLPKNQSETVHLYQIVEREFPEILQLFG